MVVLSVMVFSFCIRAKPKAHLGPELVGGRSVLHGQSAPQLAAGATTIATSSDVRGLLLPGTAGLHFIGVGPLLVARFNFSEGSEILSGVQMPCGTGNAPETSAFGAPRTWLDLQSARTGRD
jgi:hypothetical protein